MKTNLVNMMLALLSLSSSALSKDVKIEFEVPNNHGIESFDIFEDNLLVYSNNFEIGAVDLISKKYLWKWENKTQTSSDIIRTKKGNYIYSYNIENEEKEVITLINPNNGKVAWSKVIDHNYGTNNRLVSSIEVTTYDEETDNSEDEENFGDPIVIEEAEPCILLAEITVGGRAASPGSIFAVYVGNELRQKGEVESGDGSSWWQNEINIRENETATFKLFEASSGVVLTSDFELALEWGAVYEEDISFDEPSNPPTSEKKSYSYIISSISQDEPTREENKGESLLVNLDSNTGKIIWQRKIVSSVLDSPADSKNGFIYIPLNRGGVECVKVEDGKTAWINLGMGSVKASPYVSGNVYVGDFNGYYYSLSSEDGTILSRTKLGGPIISSTFKPYTISSLDGNIYTLKRPRGSRNTLVISSVFNAGGYLTSSSSSLAVTSTIGFIHNDILYRYAFGENSKESQRIGPLLSSPIKYNDIYFFNDSTKLYSFGRYAKIIGSIEGENIRLDITNHNKNLFEIEQSTDLKNWRSIGTIKGDGSGTISIYEKNNLQQSFYRLKGM